MGYSLTMDSGIRWWPVYDQGVRLIVKSLMEHFAGDPLLQRELVARERSFEAVDDFSLERLPPACATAVRAVVDELVAQGPEAYESVAARHAWDGCHAEMVEFQRLLAGEGERGQSHYPRQSP